MAEPSVFRSDLIKQIGLGINISKTYPKGHPSLIPVIRRLKILLKEIPIEQESVSMVVVEDVIMIENERFDCVSYCSAWPECVSHAGAAVRRTDPVSGEPNQAGLWLHLTAIWNSSVHATPSQPFKEVL